MRRTSTRRILNLASTKKRDNMRPGDVALNGSITMGESVMPAVNAFTKLWCATARDKIPDTSGDPNARAQRTSTVCYMRGIKEKIMFRTNSDLAWRWRRIVFSVKGLHQIMQYNAWAENSNGYIRAVGDLSTDAAVGPRNALESYLFEGNGLQDWQTFWTAKVDTNRVTIHYDKTRLFQSSNGRGRFFKHNMWIPLNKNIQYGDDEAGKSTNETHYSTLGKGGMGDVYIYDVFEANSTDANSTLAFQPEATLYWHEK